VNVALDRSRGRTVLYIDGNLQFDSLDERIYHESLVLPALSMASRPRRVLICGGGDGLALREVLRFPGIEHVDLVDYSPEVLGMAANELSELNGHSLADPRVSVHCADAWRFLEEAKGTYELIVCDFTFPTSEEEATVFANEWYERLKTLLSEGGTVAINGVSPERTPGAFACLVRTVRSAGFAVTPYRVCIPSFREAGYGCWGFLIAAKHRTDLTVLSELACPVETLQADLPALSRGARFCRAYRKAMREAPIHSLANPALLPLLQPIQQSPVDPPGLEELIRSIPAQHPYHTHEMIEELARQVCGTIASIDLKRLLDEIWKRVAELPARLREELARLREYVQSHLFQRGDLQEWSSRLFAALLIVMTLANSLAPDNAFGKGAHGIGHSSFSRGFAGEGAMHGSFASHPPYAEPSAISGSGFRSSFGQTPVDIYGQPYRSRTYFYYHSSYYDGGYYGGGGYGGGAYGGGGYGNGPQNQQSNGNPDTHQALFVADDDLLVMDNGDVVITLSDDGFLLVQGDHLALMSQASTKPITELYLQPTLLEAVRQQILDQQATARGEIGTRRDWLSWVGWTESLFPQVRQDQVELTNLRTLDRKLSSCLNNLGQAKPGDPLDVPSDRVEMFVGGYLAPDLSIELYDPSGKKTSYNPSRLSKENPALAKVIRSVLTKMSSELQADVKSNDHDLQQLDQDEASTNRDLAEYNQIYASNGYDPSYTVDYGTDEIYVTDAIARTNQDLADIAQQRAQLQTDRTNAVTDQTRMSLALDQLAL
jgi:spermidine synthase